MKILIPAIVHVLEKQMSADRSYRMDGTPCEYLRGEKAESSDGLDISETAVLVEKRKSTDRSGVYLYPRTEPCRRFNLAVFQGGVADLGGFSCKSKSLALSSRKSEIGIYFHRTLLFYTGNCRSRVCRSFSLR